MVTKQIRLNTVDDVKRFVRIAAMSGAEIELISDRYIVDGKSIMGILSLDLKRPITMNIHSDIGEAALSAFCSFTIEQ